MIKIPTNEKEFRQFFDKVASVLSENDEEDLSGFIKRLKSIQKKKDRTVMKYTINKALEGEFTVRSVHDLTPNSDDVQLKIIGDGGRLEYTVESDFDDSMMMIYRRTGALIAECQYDKERELMTNLNISDAANCYMNASEISHIADAVFRYRPMY